MADSLNSTAQHSSCKDIDLQRMVLAVIPDMHVMLFVSYGALLQSTVTEVQLSVNVCREHCLECVKDCTKYGTWTAGPGRSAPSRGTRGARHAGCHGRQICATNYLPLCVIPI